MKNSMQAKRAGRIKFSVLSGLLMAVQMASAAEPQLAGIYQAIADGRVLPGGLRNAGSPDAIAVLPAALQAAAQATTGVEEKPADPYKLCQSVGPFRMMSLPTVKFEFVPAQGRVVMLFEDLSRGYMRSFYMQRPHPAQITPDYAYQGDSIAKWQGDTLVIDTIGFNDRTWLNAITQASDALHLVERIRPIQNGRYLEYKVTASDSKVLSKPYSYVRYFEKTSVEIEEDLCEPDSNWRPDL
ncbi:MAG: hypothetical protein QM808_11695 [Steroidobacteraceae bacterium]